MTPSLYVGVAAQLTLERRLDALANNVANAGTVGFRADGLKTDYVAAGGPADTRYFPGAAREFISTAPGAFVRTGNPLDVAVRGDGWMSLATPQGVVYTRDGRLQMIASGELVSVNGYAALDASGAPLVVDPASGEISIAADGSIFQRGRLAGAIGLFAIDPAARLTRRDNSAVVADIEPMPILDFSRNGVVQGYVEQSNTNAMTEITRLIETQRAFERITAALDMSDNAQQEAIRALGAQS